MKVTGNTVDDLTVSNKLTAQKRSMRRPAFTCAHAAGHLPNLKEQAALGHDLQARPIFL
jgi:hypothetical protein